MSTPRTLFVGGGNMATAIIGGCVANGVDPHSILVIEPDDAQRQRLSADLGVSAIAAPGPALSACDTVVWAVKPQVIKEVALSLAAHLPPEALHISVAAGVTSDSLRQWLGTERIVRAMPNTPALVGHGATGLFARAAVSADERQRVDRLLAATGLVLWVEEEADLEAVTAVSGSGPAYFFYIMEAMTDAGEHMGLSRETAQRLAIATCTGAGHLAAQSDDPPAVLRERVTSKGGSTYEALAVMRQRDLSGIMDEAMRACAARAREMGQQFG